LSYKVEKFFYWNFFLESGTAADLYDPGGGLAPSLRASVEPRLMFCDVDTPWNTDSFRKAEVRHSSDGKPPRR